MSQHQNAITSSHPAQAYRHTLGFRARQVLPWLGKMFDVARERRQLAELDDRMLKDIGLGRSVAFREADRSFFDLPEHRKLHARWE